MEINSKMSLFAKKIAKFYAERKILSFVIAAAVIIGGYFSANVLGGGASQTKYVLASVQKGNLISSVTGSGQVSAVNQVDIKAKVSGDIIWIGAVAGQEVKRGQAIISLDSTDAKKEIANAETDLAEAELQYDKDAAQAPIDYQRKLETLETQKSDLAKARENTFNSMSDSFLDLPGAITGLNGVLFGYDFGSNFWNISYYESVFNSSAGDNSLVNSLAEIARRDYNTARADYDKNFADFKNITRYSSDTEIESLLEETVITVKAMAQAAKSENNLLDTVVDISQKRNFKISSTVTSFQNSLKSYIGTINSNLSSLLSSQSALDSAKQAVVNTQRDISILQINNLTGGNPISLQVSQNNIAKQRQSLADLKANLAYYTIRAPFDGVIAKINVKNLDSVSSGVAVATIVTKQQLVEISLNEIDAAKVKVGQKVTVTFDAIDGLNLTGTVSEVDTVGTVSQGVVTYSIKISLDAQDTRVKPGMSVSTTIITETKTDVLLAPSSAIKLSGDINYVEMPNSSEISGSTGISAAGVVLKLPLSQREVQSGSSNDTYTEILSGLNEGDIIIRGTVSQSQKTASVQSNSSFRMGGGAMFMGR